MGLVHVHFVVVTVLAILAVGWVLAATRKDLTVVNFVVTDELFTLTPRPFGRRCERQNGIRTKRFRRNITRYVRIIAITLSSKFARHKCTHMLT